MNNSRNGAIRWQIHDFLSYGNGNINSICHLLQDIRKLNKMQKFELENEG